MRTRYTRAFCLLLSFVMMFALAGCGNKSGDPLADMDKDDLVKYAHSLESDVEVLGSQISELSNQLKGVQGEDVKVAAITEFTDGTGRLTLHNVGGKIELPAEFAYPNSFEGYSSANIKITDSMSIKPSPNWEVSLNGDVINLFHTVEGINGTIVIGTIDNTLGYVDTSSLKDVINTFFESMPPVTISYSRIYYMSNWCGQDAKAATFIDESEAQLRLGMLKYGDTSIVYAFEYSGASNLSKDEMVFNLLQSISIAGTELKFEK